VGKPKVALVHHWLVSAGGAEKVLYELHHMYPDAPIYTAAYDKKKFPELKDADVRVTWLDRVPFAKTKHQFFPILRAFAFRSINLSKYDLVISSDAAEAKAIRKGKDTLHICYCHTPIRYYWVDYDWYVQHPPFGKLNWLARFVLKYTLNWLKRLDFDSAQKVDEFVANSKNVAERIKKYYKRDSVVIYPPIEVRKYDLSRKHGDYYLIVGRQVAYKRLDLAVDAFNELGLNLKVAGIGEEIAKQKQRSKPNIEFLGRVSDEEKAKLYGGAKAFIFPTKEDFGMVPIEAMANGTPVIAYGVGGALEYVEEGKTGVLFDTQSKEALIEAVRRFEKRKFDPELIRKQAEGFDVSVFKSEMGNFVDQQWAKFEKRRGSRA
jgi:glycosyltransferase involved in cell wall biosynthesis